MKVYKVGEMTFSLNYHFEDYFENNLEHYLVEGILPEFNIDVEIVESIKKPKGAVTPNTRPKEILSDDKRHLFFETEGGIKFLITHDHKYQNISLKLNKNLTKSLPRMEYIYLGIIFLDLAIYKNYLPLHGTALIVDNKLIIISAPSGTGKSTLRRHLELAFDNLVVVNDDKPIISFNEGIKVLGSPFSGEHAVNTNMSYPLDAIVFLEQGKTNEFIPIDNTEKVIKVIENIFKPKYEKDWEKVINQVNILIEKIPIIKYKAVNDISAATTLIKHLELLKGWIKG